MAGAERTTRSSRRSANRERSTWDAIGFGKGDGTLRVSGMKALCVVLGQSDECDGWNGEPPVLKASIGAILPRCSDLHHSSQLLLENLFRQFQGRVELFDRHAQDH